MPVIERFTVAVFQDGCFLGHFGRDKKTGTPREWRDWLERERMALDHNLRCQHGLYLCDPCYPVEGFLSEEEASKWLEDVRKKFPFAKTTVRSHQLSLILNRDPHIEALIDITIDGMRAQIGDQVPYGFSRENGQITDAEKEMPILRRILRWRIQGGCGAADIARKLSELKVPARHSEEWSRQTVTRILARLRGVLTRGAATYETHPDECADL